jgi:hypothetical protein
MLPTALAVNGGGLDHCSEALLAAAGLLEVLAPREASDAAATVGGIPGGLQAACNVFQAARDATDESVRRSSVHHEALAVRTHVINDINKDLQHLSSHFLVKICSSCSSS